MNDFFIAYESEIITATISFVVALLTTLLTHFLGNFKLRYTEKLKITTELSKRKYEGITKIREKISILSQYEDLCVTEDEDSLIPENIGKKIYTPVCCYSNEALIETASVLNDLYREFGCYLRHTTVIYLVYIKNFLFDYSVKCGRAGFSDDELRWASVPLYEEFCKWYKKFDKELICSMNKPSMRYFAHSGLKYNSLLKIYGLYFERTAPYKYINEENSMLNKIIHNREEMISQYQEAITKESNKIQLDKFEFDERGSVMKVLKISGWILFAISVILYLTGIFSGEFFINAWGLLYYGTSMKAFWLTVLSASCLLLAIILMLVVLTIKKRKS